MQVENKSKWGFRELAVPGSYLTESAKRSSGAQDNKYTIAGGVAAYFTGNAGFLTAGAAADASRHSAKAQQIQIQQQAKEEEISAKDQEIQRRKRIMSVLALQNVAGAASGTESFSGSNRNLINESRNIFQGDQLRAGAMNRLRQTGYSSRISNSQRNTKINTTSSLIGEYNNYQKLK